MKSVEQGIRQLYNKVHLLLLQILALHERIDPNVQKEFYEQRFNCFKQPQLIVSDALFVFESLSDKVQQLLSRTSTEDGHQRLEKILQHQDALIKKHSYKARQSLPQNSIKPCNQVTRYRLQDVEKKPKLQAKMSVDLRSQINLKERDLNLVACKRLSTTSGKSRNATPYAVKFQMERLTPRVKPASRQKSIATTVQNTQPDIPQNNPFQDSSIYQQLRTCQNQKVKQKSVILRDKSSKRNSKILSISIMKNSMKIW